MRIAVIGHEGRLGSELVRHGCIPIEADITNRYDMFNGVHNIEPDVVINCAAITDVNYCETMEGMEKAIRINFKGVVNLREAFDGWLIQMSTDYVFDGKHGPYEETEKYSRPPNFYGLTKQSAEAAIMSYPKPYCIVRTTCLFGSASQDDIAAKVLMSLREGEEFHASSKPPGNPTYIPYLADAILKIPELKPFPPYIVHIAGKDVITRYEFALMIANVFGYDPKLIVHANASVLGAAKRPNKAGLKVKLAEKLGLPLYTAIEGLEALKERIENETKSKSAIA